MRSGKVSPAVALSTRWTGTLETRVRTFRDRGRSVGADSVGGLSGVPRRHRGRSWVLNATSHLGKLGRIRDAMPLDELDEMRQGFGFKNGVQVEAGGLDLDSDVHVGSPLGPCCRHVNMRVLSNGSIFPQNR